MNRIRDKYIENSIKYALHPALVWHENSNERVLCWRDFMRSVYAAQIFLNRVPPDLTLYILAQNGPEWIIIHTACVCGNRRIVALDPMLPADELAGQILKAGAGALLYTEALKPAADALQVRVTELDFIGIKPDDFSSAPVEEPQSFPDADEDEAALILFTSGTVSGKKGVALSRRNLYAVLTHSESAGGYTKDDRTAVLLPLFHVFGCVMQLYMPLFNGGTVCLIESFKRLPMRLAAMRVTILLLVPVAARSLLFDLDALPESDVPAAARLLPELRLCYCGGAALPIELLKALIKHGFPIVEGYGASECTGLISSSLLAARHIGTVGTVYPSCRVRIAEDGEIQVAGDGVMTGYFRDDAATQSVMTADGWFRTGDIGRMDDAGYLTISGRKKNLLLLENGENLFPEELEEQLESLNAVREALTYASGNRLHALIYTPDREAARLSLDTWNRVQPDWRRLSKIEFTDLPLSRTHTGKKQRICKK